ncbi:related to CAAX prenyl protease 2 [Ustilago trichophora]|uniref:intramembrane prenyl-peptidase Rce1 n=1 Tax=Ustilago trichophora TaxID=86804 RepID=A0A5C3EQ97_9BASI|nr:related to CAAX prenyl protease 2 [Ustilago trichophora]
MSLIANLPNPPLGPPLLSVGFAVGASTLFTLGYVGSLYLSPAGRLAATKDAEGNTIDRDHPTVIRSRIKTASLATATTVLLTGVGLWLKGVVPRAGWLLDTLNISRLLGLPLPTPSLLTSNILPFSPSLTTYLVTLSNHILSPLLLTSLLFLGPLYVTYLDGELPFQAHFSFHRDLIHKFTSLTGIRNYLVGPLTEELVFRSCILTPLFFSGVSRSKLIFASPAFFGIAHIHHAYNVYLQAGRTKNAALRGALTATVQFAYTMVFGWYANFLYLRSASVWAPITAHVMCNVMGLPDPAGGQERWPRRKIPAVIWTTHAAGIVLFAKSLFSLTSPSVLGGSLYWPC